MFEKRFEKKGEAVCSVLMHKIAFQADNRFVERVCVKIALVLLGVFHSWGLALSNSLFHELFSSLFCGAFAQEMHLKQLCRHSCSKLMIDLSELFTLGGYRLMQK